MLFKAPKLLTQLLKKPKNKFQIPKIMLFSRKNLVSKIKFNLN